MNFSGVDFPEQLIQSIKQNQLVIFAGAGVTMAQPANGPSFSELTNFIAQGTGECLGMEPADKFLGRLEKGGVDVHLLTKNKLELLKKPSELHLATLRIFPDINSVKIVTTNFEHLYNLAIETVFSKELKTYISPALPRGNNFQGLVHVHGSINQHKEMVLTDKGFGNAYLKEGWAKDFLFDLFSHYTVLFVGYSHDDPIMNYLARSLPESEAKPRYILIDSSENNIKKWHLNNISPIESTYKNQATALNALSQKLNKPLREYRDEFSEIISQPLDNLSYENLASIKYDLNTPLLQSLWCDQAMIKNWLEWADDSGLLSSVLDTDNNIEAPAYLIYWLASSVQTDPALLLQILSKHSFNAQKELWRQIDHKVQHNRKQLQGDDIEKISVITLDYLDIDAVHSYHRFKNAIENEQFLYAFSILKRSWALNFSSGKNYRRREIDFYEPNNPDVLNEYKNHLPILIEHNCFKLLTCSLLKIQNYYDQIELHDSYDFLNNHRKAIGDHKQNEFPNCGDVLIFTLRESLLFLVNINRRLVLNYIELFLNSGLTLLERIGVYVLSRVTTESASDKFDRLMSSQLDKNKYELHHEIFNFIKILYNDLSLTEQELWLNEINKYEPKNTDNNPANFLKDGFIFRWLTWLLPLENTTISTKFKTLQEKHPEWDFSDHPDFLSYSYGCSSYASPKVTEELVSDNLIQSSPSAKYIELKNWLPNIDERQFTFESDGFDRADLINQVESAIASSQRWGLELLDTLVAKKDYTTDLWSGIIRGFSQLLSQPDDFIKILSNLSKTNLTHAEVTDYFYRQLTLQRKNKQLSQNTINTLLQLSEELFKVLNKGNSEKPLTTVYTSVQNLFDVEVALRNELKINYGVEFDLDVLIKYSQLLLSTPKSLDIKKQAITAIGFYIAYFSDAFQHKADYFVEVFLHDDHTELSFQGFSRRNAVPKKLFIKMIDSGFWARCFKLKKGQYQLSEYIPKLFAAGLFFYNTPSQRSLNKWAPIYYQNTDDDLLNNASISFWSQQKNKSVKKKYWDKTLHPMLNNSLYGKPITISQKTFNQLNHQLFKDEDYFTDLIEIIIRVDLVTNNIHWLRPIMQLPLLKKYKTDFCKYLAFIIFNKTESLYSGDINEMFTLLTNEGLQSISKKLDHKLLTLGFDFIETFNLNVHEDIQGSFIFN